MKATRRSAPVVLPAPVRWSRRRLQVEAPAFAERLRALQRAHFDGDDHMGRRRRDPGPARPAATAAPHVGNLILALATPPARVDDIAIRLGRGMQALADAAGWKRLLLVPIASGSRWCADDGRRHPPLQEARRTLAALGVGPRFDGALAFGPGAARRLVAPWFWLMRCGALGPGVAFGVCGSDLLGELCQHGNLHLSFYGDADPRRLEVSARAAGWVALDGPCRERFGPSIAGRHLVL